MPGAPTAGDQLSNPLVDFADNLLRHFAGWGSTLKPSGRLLDADRMKLAKLGINSQTLW